MSFDLISTHAAELDRRGASVSFADARYPFASRVTRREWHLLLETWERLQPYADRFASIFFDTLFASAPELRQLFGGASLDAQFLQFAHLLTSLVSAHGDRVELDRRIEAVVAHFGGTRRRANGEDAIRAAIGEMLREVSTSGMPREMRSSWKCAYISLAATLRSAARRASRETAEAA
jgi:hemoglobin-like flavoprotein